MSEFSVYLQLGVSHITDIQGYDHILFLIALCAIYKASEWKKVLILVTAFTVGHSITLALATFNVVGVNEALIEFLIALTILVTAVYNFHHRPKRYPARTGKMTARYLTALFFGLIHGLGFSNFLRALLGKDESIVSQLFAFNLGLEIGQVAIVIVIMVITVIMVDVFKVKKREWNLLLSGAAGGIAIVMMIERLPELMGW